MAFTLGFHIVLVPMGVAFTFITLLAHYRGLKHDDEDARGNGIAPDVWLPLARSEREHVHEAPVTIADLLMKPAVSGMPASENMKIDIATAMSGWRYARPRSSPNVILSRSPRAKNAITPNAPRFMKR